MSTKRVGSAVSTFLGFGSSSRASQASAAAAIPPAGISPSAVSAAPELPEGAKPYLKGAGFHVPPGTANGPVQVSGERCQVSGEQSPAPIPVKAHVRNVPAQEKSLLPESLTIDVVIAEYQRAQRITVQRVLLLGLLSEEWIRRQAGRPAEDQLDRATALKKIRDQLARAKVEKKEARVDLFVRCYWVARLFSGWSAGSQDSRAAANTLAFSALRLFPILLQRDRASDTWQLIPRYAEAGKALWSRAVAEKLSAATIDAELSKIVPARSLPIRRHRPIRLGTIEKLLARLKPADLPKVHELVEQVRAKASQPAAA